MLKSPPTCCCDPVTDAARLELAVLRPRMRSTTWMSVMVTGRSRFTLLLVDACTGTIPDTQTAAPPEEDDIEGSRKRGVLKFEGMLDTSGAAPARAPKIMHNRRDCILGRRRRGWFPRLNHDFLPTNPRLYTEL